MLWIYQFNTGPTIKPDINNNKTDGTLNLVAIICAMTPIAGIDAIPKINPPSKVSPY